MSRQDIESFVQRTLQGPVPRSAYHTYGHVLVYLRTGAYFFEPNPEQEFRAVIGIANISVSPNHRNRGECRSFFEFVEGLGRRQGLWGITVEQVVNEDLLEWLLRRGYRYRAGAEDERRVTPTVVLELKSIANKDQHEPLEAGLSEDNR